MTLIVKWIDLGRSPKEKPNPDYPKGIDVNIDEQRQPRCEVALKPYPTPRCGYFFVVCDICGTNAVITTAGRPDDPRHLTMPCKRGNQGVSASHAPNAANKS